ncbi:transcriptional regulator TyrR, partial [Pseudoalteromonas sp. S4389]
NVITQVISPLLYRKAAIGPLSEDFIQKYAHYNCLSLPVLSEDCFRFLQDSPWPGTFRQLANGIYRAVSLFDDNELPIDHLQLPTFTHEL